jgi:hypothetical protein
MMLFYLGEASGTLKSQQKWFFFFGGGGGRTEAQIITLAVDNFGGCKLILAVCKFRKLDHLHHCVIVRKL